MTLSATAAPYDESLQRKLLIALADYLLVFHCSERPALSAEKEEELSELMDRIIELADDIDRG